MKRFPARLHVLLAAQAPVGVVIRRGPAKQVCTILWSRETGKFTLGQWLRGRIYERRSDISPDGKHLIYFAMNGKWQSRTTGSWTALSRAPWLKAITLYGKGDCWNGGGLFTSSTSYWLNDGPYASHSAIREDKSLRCDLHYRPERYGNECTGVYYVRLQRDGWTLADRIEAGGWSKAMVFEKRLPHGWVLRKWAREDTDHPVGTGCYWDEHELERPKRSRIIPHSEWEWADFDGDWLMWATEGCLWRSKVGPGGVQAAQMLQDFNGMKFERRVAPY